MKYCLVLVTALAASHVDAQERVAPNDNHAPAGVLRNGVLALRLVARVAEWHPDGEQAPGTPMMAFAEEGGPARIPGPLVRVPAGTEVDVRLRNALRDTLRVYGLYARTRPLGDTTTLVLAPGESRDARFRLDAPGTYLYWGTTMRRPIGLRTREDAQLSGAIVVDTTGVRPRDRVFVIGMYSDTVDRAGTHRMRILGVINGRSWPGTERLEYTAGDTVRWRVINASADLHPMHLHGAFFRVASRGSGAVDTIYQPRGDNAAGDLAVTEAMVSAATVSITWVAERAGNWLYHCHIPEHIARRGPLGTRPTGPGPSHDHARGGMNGLVLGITVRAPRSVATNSRGAGRGPSSTRHIRLLVRPNVNSTNETPFYGYALHEGGAEPAADTGLVGAPTLDLVRGEPVRITVVNRLPEPTAVHWHGIELDSYFDGVPGFSGAGRQVAPMIAPNDSFEVRFTPPRAGTFMYHTHADETRQQHAGLVGALVVRDAGTRRDPAVDIPIVLTSPTDFALNRRGVLFNGREMPEPIAMRVGTTSRVRLMWMSALRSAVTLELRSGDSLAVWNPVAKDGADLPLAARVPQPGRVFLATGETADFEITPNAPGNLRLEARFGVPRGTAPLGTVVVAGAVQIRVAPAAGGWRDDLHTEMRDAAQKVVALARAMTPSAWEWRPTGARSTREVFMHVTGESYYAAAKFGGRVERSSGITGESHAEADAFERRTLPDDEVVVELERSLRLMADALAAIPDAGFDSTTMYARQPVSVRTAWVRSVTHLHEHLGQLIAYARANEVVPPWSR